MFWNKSCSVGSCKDGSRGASGPKLYACYLWFEVLPTMRSGRALGRNEPLQLHGRTLLSWNVPSVLWGWNQPSYSGRCWWKANLFPSITEPGLHLCIPLQRQGTHPCFNQKDIHYFRKTSSNYQHISLELRLGIDCNHRPINQVLTLCKSTPIIYNWLQSFRNSGLVGTAYFLIT